MRNERSFPELAESILGEVAARLRAKRMPSSVYRVQLSGGFTLDDATAIVPYLHALGVSHVYASPFLRASSGSPHGYDVVAYDEVDPELGGMEALERLVGALHSKGMGLIVDFVPNHMGIGSENELWQDVLENGPSSVFAPFFDIIWKPTKDELEDKVLLPVLGDQYGAVLEAGELTLEYGEGSFWLRYYENRFPINPRYYPKILEHDRERLEDDPEQPSLDLEELLSICTACHNLPPRTDAHPESIEERRREKEVIKRRLDQLTSSSPVVARFVRENVQTFNGRIGDPHSFDLLDDLLGAQAYRLAHWRVAGEEINYRRFFDINDLAAIRMEDPHVFASCHKLLLELLAKGWVDGVRVDHPDGLYDPEAYFHRLQVEHFLDLCREIAAEQVPDVPFENLRPLLRGAWASDERLRRPIYIVAEKILIGRERVPPRWAVAGTTGYDFLCALTGILVDQKGERPFDELYSKFTGLRPDLEQLLYEKKKLIMSTSMASEVNILAYRLNRISERSRRSRDFTLNSLRTAIIEYIAGFPVYRTYLTPSRLDEPDRQAVELAISRAKRRSPVTNVSIFDFLRDVVLLRHSHTLEEGERGELIEFAMRLQQLTGPVMAKGFEDTTFYIFNRLVALNEVGCDPASFGCPLSTFHEANLTRAPGSFLATTTHDTKRSEDARARLAVLSEIPQTWRKLLSRFSKIARRHKVKVHDRLAPDRNEEYLLYQTLIAAWPMGELDDTAMRTFSDRIEAYMLKAAKEAKVNTSWINPDTAWDDALALFVRRLLSDDTFLQELRPFLRKVVEVGIHGSLTQTLLKLTSPGVPDVYQGSEGYCLTLVDPDNRRPVDFNELESSLERLQSEADEDLEGLAAELWAQKEDGRVKQLITWRALALRNSRSDIFASGEYQQVEVVGPRRDHVVAFTRRRGARSILTVAPRLVAHLLDEPNPWEETYLLLPSGTGGAPWRDVLTGKALRPEQIRQRHALSLAALWSTLPVALLSSGEGLI